MDSFVFFLLVVVAVMVLVFWMRSRASDASPSSNAPQAQKAASAEEKAQMAQDIKATKTSSVEDAVSILNDLSATQSTYRHYCELVGTSMRSGGVKAPYSQREVAYYSVRCYRIEHVNGRDYETLVAQESSVDPFYFTDQSSDTRVYVNLESFGNNVILLNSANHIEGPNSDFAKAFKTQTSSGSRIGSAANACMGLIVEKSSNLLAGARVGVDRLASKLAGLGDVLAGGLRRKAAYAGTGGLAFAGCGYGVETYAPARSVAPNVMFAGPGRSGGRSGGPGRSGGRSAGPGQRPQQGRSASGHRGSSGRPSSSGGFNSMFGSSGSNLDDLFGSTGLGSFLGGGYGSGMPPAFGNYGRRSSSSSSDLGGMLLGMGLGALLNSVNTSSAQQTTYAPQDTFRGYRIVEDIVPLESPVYCIGEIYKAGEQVYMGASVAADYPTSVFATKAETEVLAHLATK